MRRHHWLAAGSALLVIAGCRQEEQPGTGGAGQAQVQAAQEQTEEAFRQAQAAQERASRAQQEASEAQQRVAKEQQELQQAQAEARQKEEQARQAQMAAQQEAQRAQEQAQASQQQALEAQRQQQMQQEQQRQLQQQRQQQELEQRQQMEAQRQPPPTPQQQTVTGSVVETRPGLVVIRTPDQPRLQLNVDESTQVFEAGAPSSITALQEGSQIRASYQVSAGQATATRIEVLQQQPGQQQ